MDKQAVLYARSARGGQDALSQQLTECREWAMANGYAVIGEYSEIENGTKEELPELNKAVAQAEEKRGSLICKQPNRLGRDMKRMIQRMRSFQRRGVDVLCLSGPTEMADFWLDFLEAAVRKK